MADIFLSYSRQDVAIARALAEELESLEYEVWLDLSLRGGERYDTRIEKELEKARLPVAAEAEQIRSDREVLNEILALVRDSGQRGYLTFDPEAYAPPPEQKGLLDLARRTAGVRYGSRLRTIGDLMVPKATKHEPAKNEQKPNRRTAEDDPSEEKP